MRFVGLTLCLLASSFAARAESVEERLSALEAKVKVLEQALREAGGKSPAAPVSVALDGAYQATLSDGKVLSLDLAKGKAVASMGGENSAGTYEVIGQRLVVTVEDKIESLEIDGDRLRAVKGNEKIEFVRIK